MEKSSRRVCVTGAAGFIGSCLVKKLLEKGHIVHATLRNLGDQSKVGLLKGLSGAESRLLLFEADIYKAEEFEQAIQGCEFVFLVATPMQHYAHSTKYNDTIEAAVDAVRSILQLCEQSGSVKRVIYTGSVTATSPLKDDGIGFKEFIDESCWTPVHLSFAHCEDFAKSYTCSKTLAEKGLLNHDQTEKKRRVEVVSLDCGLVGGDALVPATPLSIKVFVSPLTGDQLCYTQLKFLQALLGSVPSVHVEDVCEAHIFCMEKSSMSGRFLCASAYPMMQEIVTYYDQNYSELRVANGVEVAKKGVQCTSQKLVDAGFKYRFGLKQILDDSVECLKRLEGL